MTSVGLGLIFALGAIGFVMMYLKGNWIWQIAGRYGFIIMMWLAVVQESSDFGNATLPTTAGYFLWFTIGLFVFSLLVDSAFIIMVLLPKNRKGMRWKEIIFGEQGG